MEIEFKGTKGKWEIGQLKISVWGENRKGCIADCTGIHNQDFYTGFSQEEQKANAKLIASAPEMLEALKRAINDFKNTSWTEETYDIIENVIKKATE